MPNLVKNFKHPVFDLEYQAILGEKGIEADEASDLTVTVNNKSGTDFTSHFFDAIKSAGPTNVSVVGGEVNVGALPTDVKKESSWLVTNYNPGASNNPSFTITITVRPQDDVLWERTFDVVVP